MLRTLSIEFGEAENWYFFDSKSQLLIAHEVIVDPAFVTFVPKNSEAFAQVAAASKEHLYRNYQIEQSHVAAVQINLFFYNALGQGYQSLGDHNISGMEIIIEANADDEDNDLDYFCEANMTRLGTKWLVDVHGCEEE